MLKFLVITIICCLATASPSNDRLMKLETMVAEQQAAVKEQAIATKVLQATVKEQKVAMEEQGVAVQHALEEIKQLKHQLAGISVCECIVDSRIRLNKVGWSQNQCRRHTRKSFCADARGIPTGVYQVLHLLSCMGVYPLLGGTHIGYPHHTWLGYPPSSGPGWDNPRSDLDGVPPGWTWLGYPQPSGPGWDTPLPIRPGWGIPLAGPGRGTPPPPAVGVN